MQVRESGVGWARARRLVLGEQREWMHYVVFMHARKHAKRPCAVSLVCEAKGYV
jgi:hypothetical protein